MLESLDVSGVARFRACRAAAVRPRIRTPSQVYKSSLPLVLELLPSRGTRILRLFVGFKGWTQHTIMKSQGSRLRIQRASLCMHAEGSIYAKIESERNGYSCTP